MLILAYNINNLASPWIKRQLHRWVQDSMTLKLNITLKLSMTLKLKINNLIEVVLAILVLLLITEGSHKQKECEGSKKPHLKQMMKQLECDSKHKLMPEQNCVLICIVLSAVNLYSLSL